MSRQIANFKIISLSSLAIALLFAGCSLFNPSDKNTSIRQQFAKIIREAQIIAHGGTSREGAVPNTISSINESYNTGHRIFEIDLHWTKDSYMVGIHDWRHTWENLGGCSGCTPTLDEFMATMKDSGAHGMELSELCKWRTAHEDTIIVTDIKTTNEIGLNKIKQTCGTAGFVPQIYSYEDYLTAESLGYPAVIMATYRNPSHPNYDFKRWSTSKVIGISIPIEYIDLYDLSEIPDHMCVMAHTINSEDTQRRLIEGGICASYSDILPPRKST